MVTYRIDRLNKEFLRIISEMINFRIKDERARGAMLTKVIATKDLASAKVFYTVLETDRLEEIQAVLDAVAPRIRSMLGKEMRLRTVPELRFIYDDSEVRARAMEELLDRVAAMDAKSGQTEKDRDG